MGRLGRAGNQTAFAQKAALDSIRGHEDVRWLGMKMVLGGAEKPKAFFRDFQITRTELGGGRTVVLVVLSCCAHIMVLTLLESVASVQNFRGVKDVLTMSNQLTGSTSQLKMMVLCTSKAYWNSSPKTTYEL